MLLAAARASLTFHPSSPLGTRIHRLEQNVRCLGGVLFTGNGRRPSPSVVLLLSPARPRSPSSSAPPADEHSNRNAWYDGYTSQSDRTRLVR